MKAKSSSQMVRFLPVVRQLSSPKNDVGSRIAKMDTMAKMARMAKMAKRAEMIKIAENSENAKIAETVDNAKIAETGIARYFKTFKIWFCFEKLDGFFKKDFEFYAKSQKVANLL